MEQDTEFSHIDKAISSLTPNTSSSTENELPGSLPVPLLADFGHFEKQNDKHILVESNDENTDDNQTNSNDNILRTSDTCAKDCDNTIEDRRVEGETTREEEDRSVEGERREEEDRQLHSDTT